MVKFGLGKQYKIIGIIIIYSKVGTIKFYIVDIPTPFLISLADIDKLNTIYNNTRDTIVRNGKDII